MYNLSLIINIASYLNSVYTVPNQCACHIFLFAFHNCTIDVKKLLERIKTTDISFFPFQDPLGTVKSHFKRHITIIESFHLQNPY